MDPNPLHPATIVSVKIAAVLFLASLCAGQQLKVVPLAAPAPKGSLQPNLSAAPGGNLLLSWTEKLPDETYSLNYAVRRGSAWSTPVAIASHRHIFRHPAEVPSVVTLTNGSYVAEWVETPQPGGDAENIFVSFSRDGAHWSAPVMVNHDRSPVEHGLASMTESAPGEISLTWLQALKGEDGPVTLMRTALNADGKILKEEVIDKDVCACCPTSLVHTAKGLLVAYRDHTPADIRDISVLRYEHGAWTSPKNIFPDNWKLNACPVNAAAAAAQGENVAISWFTGAATPHVSVVFSNDAGTTFSKPVTVSTGVADGYTSVTLDEKSGALISWLQKTGTTTRVLIRHVTPSAGIGPMIEVASGDKGKIGYPKLLRVNGATWITWNGPEKIQFAELH